MSRAIATALPLSERALAGAGAIAQEAVKAKRWLGLDLFRFAAVTLMLEGHVFTTLLDQATKSQGWYRHHAFVHGYTAPMFMLGAGLAFGYTTFRKWDAHASGGPAARKRYTRYAWLLVLGYGLHLPTLSLRRLFAMDDPARLGRMFQVDVLHHIGVSLAIAQLLVFLVKKPKVFVAIIAALATIAVFAAPWVWGMDVSALPIWLRGYVNASGHSYFPLMPWAGFTYAGIVIAYLVGLQRTDRASVPPPRGAAPADKTPYRASTASVSERAAWPFLVLSLLFMLVPVVLDRFGPFDWPPHNFWKTNPLFFFWRLGNVLFVLSFLCFAERAMRALPKRLPQRLARAASRVAKAIVPWLKLVAAETLVIYVVHLLVLHGSVFSSGIKHGDVATEHSHGILGASLVTLGLFAAMVVVAKAWSELRKHRDGYKVLQFTLIAAIALLAIVR